MRGDRSRNIFEPSPLSHFTPSGSEGDQTPDRSSSELPVELAIRGLSETTLQQTRDPSPPLRKDPPPIPAKPSAPIAIPVNEKDKSPTLREIPLTFAVDISGSTNGDILHQEKQAIRAVCSILNEQALEANSAILPWSHRASSPIKLNRIQDLRSGGGTNPAVLLENKLCRSQLQSSDLWFLLTDGMIDEPHVHSFANSLPGAGVHGTACVIILFGYAVASPFSCNVSVGISVFAVAPHCIFLFHDVRSGKVYVFQAKGCFATLLPKEKRFAAFGDWTRWSDLVRLEYKDLAQVRVPAATKLSQDTVLLPDGRQFDMNSIYNNKITDADKMDLLSDYSALDVIILAAKTRGREAEVKSWISNARTARESKNITFLQREDIGGQARLYLLSVLEQAARKSIVADQSELMWQNIRTSSESMNGSKFNLRDQHVKNWHTFERQLNSESDLSTKMYQVFDDVMTTMNTYKECGTSSPAMLMPMTSPPLGMRHKRMSPLQSPSDHNHVPPHFGSRGTSRGGSVAQDLLFLSEFKGRRQFNGSMYLREANYNTCYVCGQENVIQTLLLQKYRGDEDTPNFPQKNSRAKHKYPMVLGNYPETDIILPLTSCDACAWIMIQEKRLPNGEHIDAALPLVSLAKTVNRQQWTNTLLRVFGNRFHEQIVLLVFLSSLCATIEDLIINDEPNSHDLVQSLKWCSRALSELPGVAIAAGLTPVGTPMSYTVNDMMPLQKAVSFVFSPKSTVLMESSFLSYPIDGFVVIVHVAELMGDAEPYQIEKLVWRRLLYHFTEQHIQLRCQAGYENANARLKEIIFERPPSPSSTHNDEKPPPQAPRVSASIQILEDTYLLPSSSDGLDQFRRMESYFASIETTAKYNAALAVFLHILLNVSSSEQQGILDVTDIFTQLRYKADDMQRLHEGMYDVFDNPKLITEANAPRLIEAGHRSRDVSRSV